MSTKDVTSVPPGETAYGQYDRVAEEHEMLTLEQRVAILPKIIATVNRHEKVIQELRADFDEHRRNHAAGRPLGGPGPLSGFH